jgi:undecaprenyl-diphosphatase
MSETEIIIKIQQSLSSPGGKVLVGITARWLIYLFIPFTLLIRKSAQLRDAVYGAAWTALLALTLSTALAAIIGRVRPYLESKGIEAIIPPNLQAGSFPSSHTAVAVGVAIALSYVNVPTGVAAFLIAILVAFGRMAAGMHYVTDIVGGAAVGVLAFVIVKLIQEGLNKV